jgi:hypothetical protein
LRAQSGPMSKSLVALSTIPAAAIASDHRLLLRLVVAVLRQRGQEKTSDTQRASEVALKLGTRKNTGNFKKNTRSNRMERHRLVGR